MLAAPAAHCFHNRDQFFTGGSQTVIDPWWDFIGVVAPYNAVPGEFSQLTRQDLLSNAGKYCAQLAETVRSK